MVYILQWSENVDYGWLTVTKAIVGKWLVDHPSVKNMLVRMLGDPQEML